MSGIFLVFVQTPGTVDLIVHIQLSSRIRAHPWQCRSRFASGMPWVRVNLGFMVSGLGFGGAGFLCGPLPGVAWASGFVFPETRSFLILRAYKEVYCKDAN